MSFAPDPLWEQKSTRPTKQQLDAAAEKRTLGEDAVPAPGHSTQHVPRDVRTINGWGADLDPANRPAVPRELPSDVKTLRGNVKHWQTPHTKIYMSNEQPGLTPVFGEACPSKGLARLVRDYAYQYGEATNRRWMTLMMANRIDVLESMIGDALRGKPDNYVREKGWAAKFKYDSEGPSPWITLGVAAASVLAVGLVVRSSRR
ncbi:MAG TPA: hypothetical protein VFN10_14455 [Thermoanaerobaculia bacterium]|nr:hypothetical protein [Thermoanaerobaculia bacterium]